jgi:hypothetical protein
MRTGLGAPDGGLAVIDDVDARYIELGMFGATSRNLDLVWAPDEHRLVAGVWAPAPPHAKPRWAFPPHVCWYASFTLPAALNGAHAQAWMTRRGVTIEVPRDRNT